MAKWSLFTHHKPNEHTHTHAYEQCLYSLPARINPSNSMIMQAVSLLSLNVLMVFFFRSLAYAMNYQYYYLLTIVRARHERISLLNKNASSRKKRERQRWRKYLLISDARRLFSCIYQLNFHFCLEDRETERLYDELCAILFSLFRPYILTSVYAHESEHNTTAREKEKEKTTGALMSIPKTPVYTQAYYQRVLSIRCYLISFLFEYRSIAWCVLMCVCSIRVL